MTGLRYATNKSFKIFYVSIVFETFGQGLKFRTLRFLIPSNLNFVAVGAGFEPAVQLPVRQFSKLLVSASHPSHLERMAKIGKAFVFEKKN